ncbi:hypothetical protein BJ508DRAFT_367436 [Ascobolus immersus RN42]|uniref:Secreted protein n=1 Tax=Ascobolus immersus RN42 TaxID=1160509 RepID=A0A3N4HG75_ASCIM|nr:hypothetical protein BJ508DRAFT_367436 [Ascobolus immersus RN42]
MAINLVVDVLVEGVLLIACWRWSSAESKIALGEVRLSLVACTGLLCRLPSLKCSFPKQRETLLPKSCLLLAMSSLLR